MRGPLEWGWYFALLLYIGVGVAIGYFALEFVNA
jgi:hypothetical protein